MSDPSDPASFVAAVVTLYVELPDTPLRASVSDQWLARRFQEGYQARTPLLPTAGFSTAFQATTQVFAGMFGC